jgi:hypothetical protein
LLVARLVDDDQSLHQRLLRLLEVRARRTQPDLVDREVVTDLVQPVRGCDEPRSRTLEIPVEPVDLREDVLRLRLLRIDRGVTGGNAGYDESRSESDEENRGLSLMQLNKELRLPPRAPAVTGTSQVEEASRGSGRLQPA